MKRILFTTLCFIYCIGLASGQEGILKGKVTDSQTGEAIPYVNVVVTSTQDNKAVITDFKGTYKITGLPSDTHKVVFTYISYKKKKVNIKVRTDQVTELNIQLKPSSQQLNEVKVTEYKMPLIDKDAASATSKQRASNIKNRYNSDFNRENYELTQANPFRNVSNKPLSTFSIDVDNASYANARRFINNDDLPPKDAIRIEEFINYFNYKYPQPKGNHPLSINTELGTCPWNEDHNLLHIGLQGKKIPKSELPPSNLVFLIDVSGSMNSPKKLPLLKKSLKLLVDQLREKDNITMVVYAGAAGMALEPTSGNENKKIVNAIESLEAGGSTAGSEGINLAYQKAMENFKEDGNNRVILATDGDFNVGVTSDGALVRMIEKKREHGVFLSVLGFGSGNYQGAKMEKLSNKGNGNYAYIDNILEAKKTLVSEFGATMNTIAKDVKIQIEFNPVHTQSYRLIGYVNRQLDKEDFADDSIDAGEIGAGHSVTALYEVVPKDKKSSFTQDKTVDLKYQEKSVKPSAYETNELGVIKFRYKAPKGDKSQLIEHPVSSGVTNYPSANFYWASAVAMFGMELRDSKYKAKTDFTLIETVAKKGKTETDEYGYRNEFIQLLKKAQTLQDVESE